MKILLTGASGFIGGALTRAWQGKYDLYAPTHGELDLLDGEAVEAYLRRHRFDVVIHAANTNDVVHRDRADRQLDYNLRMFCHLERCRALYGKMLYFGSGAEYDMRHYVPRMEETYFGRFIPADPYGFSKYLMARLTDDADNICDIRLFGVYGPGEEWRRRFLSNVIYQALNGPEMHMDRNMMFDYLYIGDLAACMERLLTARPVHHHYNLCAGRTVSLRDLAELVRQETGTAAVITMNGDDWKPEYSGSNARFVGEFGEVPVTPMEETVRRMIAFYRENGFQ